MQLFDYSHFCCVLETESHVTNFVHKRKNSVFEPFTCLKQSRRIVNFIHSVATL
jgi:hypothetical protein